MSLYSLPSLIASFLLLIPLYYTFKSKNKSFSTKLLSFLTFQFWLYMICEFSLVNAQTAAMALFWDKLIYLAIVLMPATYLYLSLCFPDGYFDYQKKKYLPFFIYLPAIFFINQRRCCVLVVALLLLYKNTNLINHLKVKSLPVIFNTVTSNLRFCFYILINH